MMNLALALTPSRRPDGRTPEGGPFDKLLLWARRRISYRRALEELHRLDDRDLDDLNLARADFPALAWRHATGAEPVARS
jgi:uncharacterized protein YjiS (DUF1127 family)